MSFVIYILFLQTENPKKYWINFLKTLRFRLYSGGKEILKIYHVTLKVLSREADINIMFLVSSPLVFRQNLTQITTTHQVLKYFSKPKKKKIQSFRWLNYSGWMVWNVLCLRWKVLNNKAIKSSVWSFNWERNFSLLMTSAKPWKI